MGEWWRIPIDWAIEIEIEEYLVPVFLFFLVFGMSATVDFDIMMGQLKNMKAILCGIFLQFAVLPAIGFAVVKILDLSAPMGITLLVVTSSPGGSFSNWWCNMFNADLGLSVAMTAISTVLSSFMLPLNLTLYTTSSYDASVTDKIKWWDIYFSLIIVLFAIALGIYASQLFSSESFRKTANRLGNFSGIAMVIVSIIFSGSDNETPLWSRGWKFYLGVASPCILGLLIANVLTSIFNLKKPERVTTSIECCYQNTGIATSVALAMFNSPGTEDQLAEAMGVPLLYGLYEAVFLGIYCIVAWKAGWTKAPANENFCVTIANNYEGVDTDLDIEGVIADAEPTESTALV